MRTHVKNGLTALHDAMVEHFKAQMPWLNTVDAYKPQALGVSVVSPAVLLEVVAMRPGRRVSNGKTPVELELAAHCILSVTTQRVEIEVCNFAALAVQFIDKNRWGLGEEVEAPTEVDAYPGMFKPDEKGFESWVVTWKQTYHLGDVALPPDYLPTDVYMGEAPAVGHGHEDDYLRG